MPQSDTDNVVSASDWKRRVTNEAYQKGYDEGFEKGKHVGTSQALTRFAASENLQHYKDRRFHGWSALGCFICAAILVLLLYFNILSRLKEFLEVLATCALTLSMVNTRYWDEYRELINKAERRQKH